MNELALFAGAGGGILGGILLGWRTVCAVETDEFCRNRLMQRQNEGHLAPFPIWDDVRTFDGRPWRGVVDVVSGGFPCQDISSAGKRAGIDGAKSGLWGEMSRIIREVGPRYVFIENSPMLRTKGLVRVLKDLACLGFNAEWCVLGADAVGAPHLRKRMWILAYSDSASLRLQQRGCGRESREGETELRTADWWPLSVTEGVDDGMAHRMDRVRATGNGQVPGVAALAWRTLIARIR